MSTTTANPMQSSSTGQTFTAGDWLDLHFQVAKPEYLQLLHAVGLQPGMHVLDAGCGSGCFLPEIAEIVGPEGRISAIDFTPEHIAAIEFRLAHQGLACPVELHTGSILHLPYPDQSFDALWCANVSQYLSDDELTHMLREFQRVLKPGGIVAIKEADLTVTQMFPLDPLLFWRTMEAGAQQGSVPIRGCIRAPRLGDYLHAAGFEQIARRSISIERAAPLTALEQQFLAAAIAVFAAGAAMRDTLSAADKAEWAAWSDPDAPTYLLKRTDVLLREGNVLALGRKPA